MREALLRSTLLSAAVVAGLASVASADLLWDNGPLATGTISRASGAAVPGPGVPAPAGTEWSELYTGNTAAGATVSPSGTTGAFRLADDFTLPAAAQLTSVTAFAYMTGSTDAQLFSIGNIRIWNGRPGDVGATVVFGDTTTDRVTSGALTNLYRIFATDSSLVGGTNSVPGTTRRIKTAVFDLGGLNLAAGTYWVDYQITSAVSPTGSVFHPYITLTDQRGKPGANGRQFTTTGWTDLTDTGNPATLPDIAQDIAFQVEGVIPEPASLGFLALGATGLAFRRRR